MPDEKQPTEQNNWPKRPGEPLNPQKSGWHWMRWMGMPGFKPSPFFWDHQEGFWHIELDDAKDNYPESVGGKYEYLGPCLPPTQIPSPAGEKLLALAAKWQDGPQMAKLKSRLLTLDDGKRLCRLHISWGDSAEKLSAEDRAEVFLLSRKTSAFRPRIQGALDS